MPSHSVSIRSIENVRYEVLDQRNDKVLEEVEESKAFFQVSPLFLFYEVLYTLILLLYSDYLQMK
jgi:hypothetical protein